jgi:hypothetical protein
MNYRAIRTLYDTFADFFLNWILSRGFLREEQRRISEAAMGGERSAQLCVLMSHKRRVRAVHGGARAAKTH